MKTGTLRRKPSSDRRVIYSMCAIAATIILIWLFGNAAGVALFMGAYVIVWGKKPWWVGLFYAVGGYAFIIAFYDQLLHIPFQRPALLDLIGAGG